MHYIMIAENLLSKVTCIESNVKSLYQFMLSLWIEPMTLTLLVPCLVLTQDKCNIHKITEYTFK